MMSRSFAAGGDVCTLIERNRYALAILPPGGRWSGSGWLLSRYDRDRCQALQRYGPTPMGVGLDLWLGPSQDRRDGFQVHDGCVPRRDPAELRERAGRDP